MPKLKSMIQIPPYKIGEFKDRLDAVLKKEGLNRKSFSNQVLRVDYCNLNKQINSGRIPMHTLDRISLHLNVSVNYLIGLEVQPDASDS